jgi:hypothetical protein
MSYEEILETRGDYRVRLVLDESPEEPYDDSQSPLLRIEQISCDNVRAEHIQIGAMRPAEDDAAIENAVRQWQTTPGDSDWKLFEKYLRAFFGVTAIETYWSGSYWYVTYNSRAWRKAAGWITDEEDAAALARGYARPNMDEYKAWINGEVYGYVVERKALWRKVDPTTDDPDYLDAMTTWETVDFCWGFYGDEYAREAALKALAAEAGELTETERDADTRGQGFGSAGGGQYRVTT